MSQIADSRLVKTVHDEVISHVPEGKSFTIHAILNRFGGLSVFAWDMTQPEWDCLYQGDNILTARTVVRECMRKAEL